MTKTLVSLSYFVFLNFFYFGPAKPTAEVDVSRLDFRIGKIMSAKKHPEADTLFVEESKSSKVKVILSQSKFGEPDVSLGPSLILSFCSMKRLGVFLLPLDGILVHRRLPPSILPGCPPTIHYFPFIHLGGERHCESRVFP